MYLLRENGAYRKVNVAIGFEKVLLADFNEVPGLMRKFIQYVNSASFMNSHPIKQACLIHYNFVQIHPFKDGNGRISRLLMNYVLLRGKYPITIIENADKQTYFRSIAEHKGKSHSTKPVQSPFCNFLMNQIILTFKDNLDSYISIKKRHTGTRYKFANTPILGDA
ncbi:predicted protein [Naegleria gruberi]|uniref:Predicted protein n=1 Tax=Naegleria gruberi TaxID=5762 RepID=D2VQG5_NAEGR|nr:uncharacterized protein NAEGRDRAFT_71218 [Naegleria gruberi]EFC40943.1 predicted protein [Naegleria gruberi]|eukprot:XP_002673687.1 predicted protein [Naegleria gruberi strain NEG-M]